MKPRIFIAMHYLEIGGAEASLIGLLEALDPQRVEVDLFLYAHRGLFMSAIPEYVRVLPEVSAYAVMESPIGEALRKGQIGVTVGRIWAKYRYKRYRSGLSEKDRAIDIGAYPIISRYVRPFLPSLEALGEYDLAISYLQPHDIVRKKVKARKYLAWIHTDYSTVHIDAAYEQRIWAMYDHIVSISRDVTQGFLGVFPSLKERIVECENMLPKAYIETRADGPLDTRWHEQKDVLTLCTVGRICYPKNMDNIPYMAHYLVDLFKDTADTSGFRDFKWYIVGPGEHRAIDALSERLGVRNRVVFLGPSDNPYPYIRHCDIYVHPSRYEGKSIVVREAQILCKPVIITNYPTAHSQLTDGVDGVICGMDNRSVAKAIFSLANDQQRRERLVSYLKEHDYAGMGEVEKIYNLLKNI